MLQDLVVHPLFQLAGFVVGIIGLLVGYYFYRQTRNRKALRYTHRDIPLVVSPRNHGGAISISYNGEPVSKLRRIGVIFWNAGDVTINFNEELQGLRVTLPPGYKILGAYVAASDDVGGGFRVEENENVADIRFDYLRSKEGVLYYIDYSGPRNQATLEIVERTRNLARRGYILVDLPTGARLILFGCGAIPVAVLIPIMALNAATTHEYFGAPFLFLISGFFLFVALRGLAYGKAQALYSKEFGLP